MNDISEEDIFRKLEPYLKCGLSLHKACLQAETPKSKVYDLYTRSKVFSEKIDRAKNYHAILVTDILTNELVGISQRQKQGKPLKAEELRFTQWVATNSLCLKEEFGVNEGQDQKAQEMDAAIAQLSEIINNCGRDS